MSRRIQSVLDLKFLLLRCLPSPAKNGNILSFTPLRSLNDRLPSFTSRMQAKTFSTVISIFGKLVVMQTSLPYMTSSQGRAQQFWIGDPSGGGSGDSGPVPFPSWRALVFPTPPSLPAQPLPKFPSPPLLYWPCPYGER